jgi:hypothetical protein
VGNPPTHKLDVNGTVRIRTLAAVPQLDVVVADAIGCLFRQPISSVGFGLPCSPQPPQFNLPADWRVGLGNFNLYFDGNGQGNAVNNVVIGKNCAGPSAKLDVFQNSGVAGAVGIKSLVLGSGDCSTAPDIAGWFEATSSVGKNVALFVPVGGGIVSIGYATPCNTGATVEIAGTGTITGGPWSGSDMNLKTNIQTVTNALSKVKNLRGVSFNWNPSQIRDTGMTGIQFGLISQEVDTVIPGMVKDFGGVKFLSYGQFTPFLVEAIKDLDSIITSTPSVTASSPGTANFLPKFTASNSIANSGVFESSINDVGIGTTTPAAKLHLFGGSASSPNRIFLAQGSSGQQLFDVRDDNSILSSGNIAGTFFNITHTPGTVGNASSLAVQNNGASTINAKAGEFIAQNATSVSIGVQGSTIGSPLNRGVQGNATSAAGQTAVGGYFNATGTGTNFALHADGDILFNGILSGSNNVMTSDQVFKTNVDSIQNAASILMQLLPKTFFFDTANTHNIQFSSKRQYGLTAQDVESILPELVYQTTKPAEYDSFGNIIYPALTYKTLNYQAFIAILIKGVQQQQAQINYLLSNTRSQNPDPDVHQTDVTLINKTIVLDQNKPNPFRDNTTITYEINRDFQNAMIVFTDQTGTVLRQVPVTEKGKGQINVFASDLTSGIYTYTLVVDGITVESRKMVKAK